jgi:hypothetical protein
MSLGLGRCHSCSQGGTASALKKRRRHRHVGQAPRARPETQQKLKDAGLNPATASKHALGGANGGGVLKSDTHKSNNSHSQPTIHGKKSCKDVHFEGIRDKKGFANRRHSRRRILHCYRHHALALGKDKCH